MKMDTKEISFEVCYNENIPIKRINDFDIDTEIKCGLKRCRKNVSFKIIKNSAFLVIPILATVLTFFSQVKDWSSNLDVSAAIFVLITALMSSFASITGFIECGMVIRRTGREFADMKEVILSTQNSLLDGEYQHGVTQIQNYGIRFTNALRFSDTFTELLLYLYADCLHLQSHYYESISVLKNELKNNTSPVFILDYMLLCAHCYKHIGRFLESWLLYKKIYKEMGETSFNSSVCLEINNKLIGTGILYIYQTIMRLSHSSNNKNDYSEVNNILVETIKCAENASLEYQSRYSPVLSCYYEFFKSNIYEFECYAFDELLELVNTTLYGIKIVDVPKALTEQIKKKDAENNKYNYEQFMSSSDKTGVSRSKIDKKLRLISNSKFILAELLRTRNSVEQNYNTSQRSEELQVALKLYLECYDTALLEHDYNLFSQCCVALEILKTKNGVDSGHKIDLTSIKTECGNRSMKFNMELCGWALEAIQTSSQNDLIFALPMVVL